MVLQVVPGAAKDQSPQTQAKESAANGKQARVLIVDDEPSICTALSLSIKAAEYTPIIAQSGESALAVIRTEHVDVMLIDLLIPDMRGDVIFEVAAGYQPHLRYQTVFMTGDLRPRALSLIAACKCNYLRKPFDLDDMLSAIAALAPRVHEAAG